jgi:hypothetical protein
MLATLLTLASLLIETTEDSLAPWAANHHPSDVARREVHELTAGRAQYDVFQAGTMDGQNCRSPQGVWQAFQQSWESNRSVVIENVGQTDIVNPWLSNGRNDFRTLDEIVARAVRQGMTDGEKARALWWQETQHRFHLEGDNDELLDPVKVFNVYGYNSCGNDSISLGGQWRHTGLKVAPARLVGHCVTQVFYDGRWHLMDGDMHSIYLLRDNETVDGKRRARGGGGEDGRRDLDNAQSVRSCGRTGRSRGRRRTVYAFLGWAELARRRQRPRRVLGSVATCALCLLSEMPVDWRGAAAKVTDRQRSTDGPAHASRHGYRQMNRRLGR